MPLDPRDRQALEDLLRFGRDAVAHVADLTRDAFLEDRKSQQATMYAIATVAESTGRLSEAFKAQYQAIPWPMIKGMRNIMLHEYGRVDLPTVYRVATQDLPALLDEVERILQEDA